MLLLIHPAHLSYMEHNQINQVFNHGLVKISRIVETASRDVLAGCKMIEDIRLLRRRLAILHILDQLLILKLIENLLHGLVVFNPRLGLEIPDPYSTFIGLFNVAIHHVLIFRQALDFARSFSRPQTPTPGFLGLGEDEEPILTKLFDGHDELFRIFKRLEFFAITQSYKGLLGKGLLVSLW